MKKKLQFIVFGFVAVFLFAGVGMAQDIQLQTNENPAPAPAEANEKEDGEWLGYYDQETAGGNGLGLDAEGLFDVAIRWESADLADYDGWEITKIRVYMGDEPTSASAKIWQGPDEASLDLKVEEEMTIEEEDWVEVSFDGYEIDTNHELWVGWEVGDPGDGFFPAGMDSDDSEEHDGYANLVNLGDGWDILSDFGIPGNFVVEAYVEPADGGNGDEDMHTVTLNVDMTDAVAAGDVAFDPDNHDVWVTGTFADWAEPGENPDFQMQPADKTTKDEEALYEEHFSPANETGELPDGWVQKKADNAQGNNLQDLADDDTRWWRYSELFDMGYDEFYSEWIHTEDASMHINWNVEAEENVYAITPEIELPQADEITLEFWKYFPSDWVTELDILLELDGEWEVLAQFISDVDENLYDEAVHIDLTDKVGTARIAFVYKWSDGLQMNVDAITVNAIGVQDEPGEEDIYTITFEAAEGEHEYKYFLVEDEPTWDIGEWAGDPNRALTVEADMVVDEEWGDLVVSVPEIDEEQLLSVYPNPVSSQLYVSSNSEITDIKVYDITGRMLIQQTEDVIDVSGLRTGVYIIQVNTPEGTEARRFNVAR